MSTITRTWLAFAAIGTGLIHVALVIGSPLALGIPLAALGLTEFGWGVLAFARDTIVFARAAVVVALSPVVLWALLLVTSTMSQTPELAGTLGVIPLGVATIFELFIAGMLAAHLRPRAHAEAPAPSVGRYMLGLVVGALAVAGLTTPALAATEAGLHAQPHGEQVEAPTGGGFVVPAHGH